MICWFLYSLNFCTQAPPEQKSWLRPCTRDWVCSSAVVKIAISDSLTPLTLTLFMFWFSWHGPLFFCYCFGFSGTESCTHTNAKQDDEYLWYTALSTRDRSEDVEIHLAWKGYTLCLQTHNGPLALFC